MNMKFNQEKSSKLKQIDSICLCSYVSICGQLFLCYSVVN